MAEKEYIEREALIAEIIAEADKEGKKSYNMAEKGCNDLSVKYTHGEYCYSVAAHIAETAPAADVVEVVRCKDCKNRHNAACCALWYASVENKEYFIERGENFFCAYGERR